MSRSDVHVGPVLEPGAVAAAVILAIKEANPEAELVDRGSYIRVLVANRCVLSRAAVERCLGRPFQLPGDLEAVMPSFRGGFDVSGDEATWTYRESVP